jgi:hypothetical protein
MLAMGSSAKSRRRTCSYVTVCLRDRGIALTGTLLSVLIPSMDRDLTNRRVPRLYHSTKCSSNEDRHITRCECVDLCVCMCVFVYEYIRIYLSTTE